MKKLILILTLSLVFMSCKYKTTYTDTKVKCVIDSVEYHGVGHDNTMQTTPYWKLYLREPKIKITSHRCYEKGDTIEVIQRQIKK